MAYTMRNLVAEAYKESGVLGNGMTMQPDQQEDGMRALNMILDTISGLSAQPATASVTFDFNGQKSYTIGEAPELITDPVPDIIVPAKPAQIDGVFVFTGGQRYQIGPVDPTTYFGADNILNQPYPSGFYFQRSEPISQIHFMDGAPSGQGTITFRAILANVTPNTDYSLFPRHLRPYLVYELGARLCVSKTFDPTAMKQQANNAWSVYQSSCYQGQRYIADTSAPGYEGGAKYNIFRG